MSSFWIRTWWSRKRFWLKVTQRSMPIWPVYQNGLFPKHRNIFSLLFASIFCLFFQWLLHLIVLNHLSMIFLVSPFLFDNVDKEFLKKPRIWEANTSCALWPGLIHQYLILLPTCFFISLLSQWFLGHGYNRRQRCSSNMHGVPNWMVYWIYVMLKPWLFICCVHQNFHLSKVVQPSQSCWL